MGLLVDLVTDFLSALFLGDAGLDPANRRHRRISLAIGGLALLFVVGLLLLVFL